MPGRCDAVSRRSEFLAQTSNHQPLTADLPTLIMSDTGDVRVPITQSFEMYRALSDNGVPVKFIAYPVSGHSPEDPVHAADIYRRYAEWFSQYLK